MTTLWAAALGGVFGFWLGVIASALRSLWWSRQERPMSEQKKASAMFRRNSARVKEGTR